MNEQLISFETGKSAKEKGFNWECGVYATTIIDKHVLIHNGGVSNWNAGVFISIPTQSLLQKWLRDVHDIHIQIDRVYNCYQFDVLKYDKNEDCNEVIFNGIAVWDFDTYENALEQALQEAINSIKL